MDSIEVIAHRQLVSGRVKLPLSKSISNRALMINAISGGIVETGPLSEADDTVLLKKLLKQIEKGSDKHLDTQNAGTAYRFLTAYLAITPGEWVLDGSERMRERPIGPLVDALRALGADITYMDKENHPPLLLRGKRLSGGKVSIAGNISSQFISALMMIGPRMGKGLTLEITGNLVSSSYLYPTRHLMKKAGASVIHELPFITIKPRGYERSLLPSEADWSSAAFFYELVALSQGGNLFLEGLKEKSYQPDSLCPSYFNMLGVDTIFRDDGILISKRLVYDGFINLSLLDNPDLAPPLIVCCAAKGWKGAFMDLDHLAYKESNRLFSLSNELAKCKMWSSYYDDSFNVCKGELIVSEAINTYGDHRIAMAFAPLAILGQPITINDPEVVNKSFPGFWDEIQKVLGTGG